MNSESLYAKKTIWRAIDEILAEVQMTLAHIWGKMPTFNLALNVHFKSFDKQLHYFITFFCISSENQHL